MDSWRLWCPSRAARHRRERLPVLVLTLILLCACVIRMVAFVGYTGSDDGAYAVLAYQLATGEFKPGEYDGAPVFPLRLGLIMPTALGFAIAGPNEIVMIVYPFFLSLCGIVIAFYAGRAFFSEHVGLIAAALMAILPIDVGSASRFLPDLPAAVWAMLGVLLFYFGSKSVSLSTKLAYGTVAGIAFGMSWLCKETIVYLLPFLGISTIYFTYHAKRNIFPGLSTALIFCAILFIESMVYYQYTNDVLFRFHETERNYEHAKVWFFTEGSRLGWKEGEYWPAVAKRIFRDGPSQIALNRDFGLVPAIALIAIAYAMRRKVDSFVFPGLWFLSLVLMFNFFSSSLKFYRPLVLFSRYLYPIVFPAVILTAGLIDNLLGQRSSTTRSHYLNILVGITIVTIITFFCAENIYLKINIGGQSQGERVISRIVGPDDVIYTDSRTASILRFFWKYPKQDKTINYEGMNVIDVAANAYVLINRKKGAGLQAAYGYKLPAFYDKVPKHWGLKWRGDRTELYWIPVGIPQ